MIAYKHNHADTQYLALPSTADVLQIGTLLHTIASMKIIILGAGRRGTLLARRLVQEHRDVVLVDSDHKRIADASSRLDCMFVQGSGLDREILRQADIEHASHFVAVTDSDEVNLVACGLIENLKPEVSTIAAIRNLTYTGKDGLQESVLGINHIVNPEAEAARSISLLIDRGMFSDTICFDTCGLVLHNITIEAGSRFADMDVQTLRKSLKINFIIAALLRDSGEAVVPSGGIVLHCGDTVSLVASEPEMDKIYKILGKERFKPRKIAIIGGSKIARFLLKTQTPSRRKHMVLVDQDPQVCESFATLFPEILVIRSDITDETIFQDEHLDSFDLLMSLTDNDELNIITASYAKRVGIDRTIALIK